MAEQDRRLWRADYIADGVVLITRALPRGLIVRPFADLPPLQIGAAWRGDHRTPALTALLAALPKFPAARSSP